MKADLQNFPCETSFLVPLEFGLNNTAGQLRRPHIIANAVQSYSDSLQSGRYGDRIPVEARFSAPIQTGPEFHPTCYTMGTGSFLGVKRPEWRCPPTTSSVNVKETIELYLYSPLGLRVLFEGEVYLYL